jgi:predicted amidohydrolase
MLAVDGRGVRVAYRKVWVDVTEAPFAPGSGPARLDIDGWRLGLAICRDTGIAQHQEDTAALGIDAYVAGTLMHVDETAIQDERARRIATGHGVWVAFASFAGSTGGGYDDAAGASGIWAPDGAPVAQVGQEAGAIARATLTPSVSGEPATP